MTVLIGPYCFVCGGRNVERRWIDGVTAWTSTGPRYGPVQRDVCLDCEQAAKGGWRREDG
jgi:hypothetical protein